MTHSNISRRLKEHNVLEHIQAEFMTTRKQVREMHSKVGLVVVTQTQGNDHLYGILSTSQSKIYYFKSPQR